MQVNQAIILGRILPGRAVSGSGRCAGPVSRAPAHG